MFVKLGLTAPERVPPPYAPDFAEQIEVVCNVRPPVLTVHLGDLPAGVVTRFRGLGIRLGCGATSVREARRLEAMGADFVIAQGGEAGGHRGTFLGSPEHAMTGTLALVRQVVRAVRVPVVAAGGIMDGAGIAAVLALGAQAAQLGTAFVVCPESGAPAGAQEGRPRHGRRRDHHHARLQRKARPRRRATPSPRPRSASGGRSCRSRRRRSSPRRSARRARAKARPTCSPRGRVRPARSAGRCPRPSWSGRSSPRRRTPSNDSARCSRADPMLTP